MQATVGSILVLPVIQCYCGFLYVPIINTSFIIFVTLYGNRKECFTCTAVYCTSRSLHKAAKTDWNVFLFAFPLIFSILNRIVPLSSASPLIQIIFICFLKKNFLYQSLNFWINHFSVLYYYLIDLVFSTFCSSCPVLSCPVLLCSVLVFCPVLSCPVLIFNVHLSCFCLFSFFWFFTF